jgi:hypothetical protein
VSRQQYGSSLLILIRRGGQQAAPGYIADFLFSALCDKKGIKKIKTLK